MASQQAVAVEVKQVIVDYAASERQRLSAAMPAKAITICEDESFHPGTCLVAVEPVSNHLLLGQYAPDRKVET